MEEKERKRASELFGRELPATEHFGNARIDKIGDKWRTSVDKKGTGSSWDKIGEYDTREEAVKYLPNGNVDASKYKYPRPTKPLGEYTDDELQDLAMGYSHYDLADAMDTNPPEFTDEDANTYQDIQNEISRRNVWNSYDNWGKYAFADQTPENIEKGNKAAEQLYADVSQLLSEDDMKEFDDLFGTFKNPDDVVDFLKQRIGGTGPSQEDESDISEWLSKNGISPESPLAKGLTPENKKFIRELMKQNN